MTQTHDLQSLLEGASLGRFRSSLEQEENILTVAQLKQRKDLESILSRIGMTKSEIEKLKKKLKSAGHHETVSLFSRSKKTKVSKDSPSLGTSLGTTLESIMTPTSPSSQPCPPRCPLQPVRCTRGSNTTYDTDCVCSNCRVDSDYSVWHTISEVGGSDVNVPVSESGPCSSAPCKIPRIQNGQIGPILSRDNQLLSRDQQQLSTSASSIASVFRRQINDIYVDFPNKFDVPHDRPMQRGAPPAPFTQGTLGKHSTGDVVSALSGTTYNKTESCKHDETSPLLHQEAARMNVSRNTFDNVAAVESSSISRNPSEAKLANGHSTNGKNVEEGIHLSRSTSLFKVPEALSKKKKQKPKLKITISNEHPELRIKPMTAADNREIEEAMKLANNFARMTVEPCLTSSPRSPATPAPGTSSKESLPSSGISESPSNPTTTGHFFRFPFRRKASTPKEDKEKKSFLEFSGSSTADSSGKSNMLLTPEAMEAYEKLVTKTPDPVSDRSFRYDKIRNTRRHLYSMRNALSESDRDATTHIQVMRKHEMQMQQHGKADHPFLPVKNVNLSAKRTLNDTDAQVLRLFSDSALSRVSTRPPLQHSKSLNCNPSPRDREARDREARERSKEYMIMLPGQQAEGSKPDDDYIEKPIPSPRIMDPKSTATVPQQESIDPSIDEESVPAERSATPPPLPPRAPLRTVASGRPRGHHRHETSASSSSNGRIALPVRLAQKKRSYSESVPGPKDPRHGTDDHQYLPLREARSTELPGAKSALDPESSLESLERLDSNPDSQRSSSVYDSSSSRQYPRTPTSPFPLPANPASTDNYFQTRQPHRHQHPLSMSVGDVKHDATDNVTHWNKSDVSSPLTECQSESDLQWDASEPIPGRYETSDCVSYEDLMEFALDSPHPPDMSVGQYLQIPDKVRVMLRMFPNIAMNDITETLTQTNWDLHRAVKLLKLKQLRLGDEQQCKDALQLCQWSVDEAAAHLLHPSSRAEMIVGM